MSKPTGYYWIYILECDDGSLYTGYTTNLVRRYRQHVEGRANSRYTSTHRPVRLAQCWRLFDTVGVALKVEHFVKRRPRRAKDALVSDPKSLRGLLSKAFEREVDIYTTDPSRVENESKSLDLRDIYTAEDPFSKFPRVDC